MPIGVAHVEMLQDSAGEATSRLIGWPRIRRVGCKLARVVADNARIRYPYLSCWRKKWPEISIGFLTGYQLDFQPDRACPNMLAS
jgi:hypothetical protein